MSSWVTLDQARIQEFAHCTGDHQWIHTDPERAERESPFGSAIAHGFLDPLDHRPHRDRAPGRTRMTALGGQLRPGNVRFVNPVRAGKRVRNHITLEAVKARSNGRYFVTTDNSIEIEGEKRPALTATHWRSSS